MKARQKRVLSYTFLLSTWVFLTGSAKAQFDEAFIQSHSVRVIAKSGGKASAASGFLWKNSNQVVTSLHSIPAGSDVIVECRGGKQPASVSKMLVKADLVLLDVTGLPSECLPFTEFDPDKPKRNTPLWTFGYHGGAKSLTDREFKKRFAFPERLNDLIKGKPLEDIIKLGFPDPKLDIYFVQGGLLPGYSGGPVVDEDGNLIGIVDGGLNKGASAYNWVIPAKFLDQLVDAGASDIPNSNNVSGAPVFASGIANVEDSDVLEYTEEGRKFSWVLTKSQSIEELLSTADDAEGVGQLAELFAGSASAEVSAKMIFDVYEEQNQGLIIAVPKGQGLRYEDDGSDGEWLMSGGGAAGFGSAGSRYAYSDWDIENDTGDVIEPNDPDYYKHLITSLVIDCHNPGKSFCTLDKGTIRMIDFGQGNKILRVGVLTDYYDVNVQPHYDYYSFAVQGNTPFGAQGQIPLQRNSGLYQCLMGGDDENACNKATVDTDKLAQLFAVHLTSFASLSTDSNSKILNTEFQYDAARDWASTILVPYNEGKELRLFNTRGKEWRVYENNDYEIATEVYRDLDKPNTNPMVVIQYEDTQYRFPIRGGEYYYSGAGDPEWHVSGVISPYWPQYNYYEKGELKFVNLGGVYWNVYSDGNFEEVVQVRSDFDQQGRESFVLAYRDIFYSIPQSGGEYFKSENGQWITAGVVGPPEAVY